jgi:hypothetical protein
MASADVAAFSLTFHCEGVNTCFPDTTFGLADLNFFFTGLNYTVAAGQLSSIDLVVPHLPAFPYDPLQLGSPNESGGSTTDLSFQAPTGSCDDIPCRGTYTLTPVVSGVPEPGTVALLALGLSGLAYRRSKQRPS